MPKSKIKSDTTAMLVTALDLDEDDLTANDSGLIGSNQLGRLQHQIVSGLNLSVASACLLLASVILLINLPMLEGQTSIILSFLCSLLGFLHSINQTLSVWCDRHKKQVKFVEGRVNQKVGIFGLSYKINVGKRTFEVSQATFLAFKNRDPYRIYYTPRSKILLSAEWLNSGDHFFETPIEIDEVDEFNQDNQAVMDATLHLNEETDVMPWDEDGRGKSTHP